MGGVRAVHYGFPRLPNTAYAKLGTGIDRWETAAQGFYYFRDSLWVDPLTLLVIGGSLAAVFLRGNGVGCRWLLASCCISFTW